MPSYKYLGCVIDEHLVLKETVEEKAAAGRRALSAWLNRCKAEVGDVGVGILKKLMSALVDSTMLYGVEIWGCMRNLESIEQVQLRAFRMFFGVGTLHPKASLMMEMESLPVVWEARVRCVQLLSVAWRNVRDEWRKEMPEKLKLSMMKRITEC